MEITVNAKLLSAESKPYEFAGNKGTSHKIRLSVEGEIFVCKSTPEQVTALLQSVGEEGKAVLSFQSRKENLSLTLVSFEV